MKIKFFFVKVAVEDDIIQCCESEVFEKPIQIQNNVHFGLELLPPHPTNNFKELKCAFFSVWDRNEFKKSKVGLAEISFLENGKLKD